MSSTPNPLQTQQAEPEVQTQQPTAPNVVSTLSDETALAGSVNLHRAFSKLNEALMKLADESGVVRTATIPHISGQSMAEHLEIVGQTLAQAGGLTANVLTATHSVHGPDGGVTVAHPAEKLRQTIVTKDNKNAKAAIDACKSFISKAEFLLGETRETKIAKSQLSLVGKSDGAGMTVADLMLSLINIPVPVIQAVARAHSGTKDGGHAPHLRAPRQ